MCVEGHLGGSVECHPGSKAEGKAESKTVGQAEGRAECEAEGKVNGKGRLQGRLGRLCVGGHLGGNVGGHLGSKAESKAEGKAEGKQVRCARPGSRARNNPAAGVPDGRHLGTGVPDAVVESTSAKRTDGMDMTKFGLLKLLWEVRGSCTGA